jgi:hypothetical protein
MNMEKLQMFTAGVLFGTAVGLFVGVVGIPMWFGI